MSTAAGPRGWEHPGASWVRHRLAAAVAAAISLHAAVLLMRPASSGADRPAAAAPLMHIRTVPLTRSASTPPEPVPATVQSAPSAEGALNPPVAAAPPEVSPPLSDMGMPRDAAFVRASGGGRSGTPTPSRDSRSTALPDRPSSREHLAPSATQPSVPAALESAAAPERLDASRSRAAQESALPLAPEYLLGAGLDPGPRPLGDVEPDYPAAAHLQEGTVVLRLLIDQNGTLDNVAVVHAEPKGLFEQAAIEAFSRVKYAPGLVLGTPVKSQITVEVHFLPINRAGRISGRSY